MELDNLLRFRACILLLAIGLFASCDVTDVPEGMALGVSFRVDKNHYNLGATVKAVLENNLKQPVLYNLCTVQLEFKQQDGWQTMGPRIVCKASAKTLKPGHQQPYDLTLNDSLLQSEGVYRLRTSVEIEKPKILTTRPFEVTLPTQ